MALKTPRSWILLFLSDKIFFAFFGVGALLVGTGWVAGEGKDWLAWFAASVLTIFFLLKAITNSPPLQVSTRRFLIVLWALGLVDAVLVRWVKNSALSDFLLSIALFLACAALVARALRPFTRAAPPIFKGLPALTATTVVFAVTRLSFWRKGFLGPFVQWDDFVLPALFLLACALLPRVLASGVVKKPLKATFLCAVGFGFLSLLTPVVPETAAHHWSFYLGPVDLVRAGGHLLHSVPSQYGFGSILALTLLPFDSVTSLYFSVWSSTLAFALLVAWNTLKCFGQSALLRVFAAAGVFSAVYILPGWVAGSVGSFACPSVTGFRFFWSALIAVWVPVLYSKPTRLRHKLLFALSVGCASLWAFESFLYTAAVLGFSLVGAAAFSCREGSLFPLQTFWQRIFAPAVFGLAGTVAFTYLYYQWAWGLWPDAYAFIEFPKAYSNGFGALGIAWHSAAVFLGFAVWAIGVSCVLVVESKQRSNESLSLNAFSAMGYALGVLTYFISRSHDNNAVNLVPSLILSLSLVVSTLPTEPLSRLALQTAPIVRAFWFLTIAFSLALGVRYFPLQPKSALPGLDRVLIESQISQDARGVIDAIRTRSQNGEKFSVAPDGPDVFSSPFLPYVQGLPIAPPAEYYILGADRQALYLDRWRNLSGNRSPHVLSILWPNTDCAQPALKNPLGSYLQENAIAVGLCEVFGPWSLQRYEVR